MFVTAPPFDQIVREIEFHLLLTFREVSASNVLYQSSLVNRLKIDGVLSSLTASLIDCFVNTYIFRSIDPIHNCKRKNPSIINFRSRAEYVTRNLMESTYYKFHTEILFLFLCKSCFHNFPNFEKLQTGLTNWRFRSGKCWLTPRL